MLSIETENEICKLFQIISEGEMIIEVSRKNLMENEDFDPYKIFKYLDTSTKNNIDSSNIIYFLQKNSVHCTEKEANYLINLYDSTNKQNLCYPEFLNIILPNTNPTIRKIEKVFSYSNKIFPFALEYLVVRIFEKEINLIRDIDSLIDIIKKRKDFSVFDLFRALKGGLEAISYQNFGRFLQRNNFKYNEDDIRRIMRKLDVDKDGYVSIQDLEKLFNFKEGYEFSSKKNKELDYYVKQLNVKNFYDNNNFPISPIQKNENFNYTGGTYSYTTTPKVNGGNKQLLISTNNAINIANNNEANMNKNSPNNNDDEEEKQISEYLVLRKTPNKRFQQNQEKLEENKRFQQNQEKFDENKKKMDFIGSQTPNRFGSHLNITNTPSDTNMEMFISFLKLLMEVEFKIEQAKMDLAQREDFNIEDAFKIFEYTHTDYITERDLHLGLVALGISFKPEELKLLVKKYDLEANGSLSYSNFFDMLVPFNNKKREEVESRGPQPYSPKYNKGDIFLTTTKYFLKNLFMLILDSESFIEKERQKINNTFSLNLREMFNQIDIAGSGFFTIYDLENFLKKHEVNYIMKELNLLFIRLDKDRKGKVDMPCFMNEFKILFI